MAGLNQNAIAVIQFMLDDLCKPAGIVGTLLLKETILILHFYVFETNCFAHTLQ